MNTSTISAALNSVPPNTKQISAAPDAEIDDAKPRFSDIMKDQRASGKVAADAADNATQVKKGRPKASDESKSASDAVDATALLAGSNGLTLPELALSIAAQAASSPIAKDVEHAVRMSNNASSPASEAKAASSASEAKTASSALEAKATPTNQSHAAQTAIALAASDGRAMPAAPDGIAPPASRAIPVPNGLLDQPDGKTDKTGKPSDTKHADSRTQNPPSLKTDDKSANNLTLTAALPNALAPAGADPRHLDASDASTQTSAPSTPGIGTLADSSTLAATTPAPQTNAQAISLSIGTPLQSAQWSDDFGRQFATLTQRGHGATHTAELSLNPPDLGPLRISISVSDNVAHAVFMSPHAAVRQAVENALPQLQQTLANAGISLGQASVNDQAERQDAFDELQPGKRKHSVNAIGGIGSTGGGLLAHATPRGRTLEGLVDTFA